MARTNIRDSTFACPVCTGEQYRLLGRKNLFDLWQCLTCRTIFTGKHAQQAALKQLYDHYYDYAQFHLHPVMAQSLARVIASFERFRHSGRLLDIGFGEGGLLQVAEQRGWQCYGTEISPRPLEFGRQRGWVVTDKPAQDARFPPHSFDVVTMIELLEHLAEPQPLLETAARWLRPGGLLYLTTPNAKSLNQRLLGVEWSVFSPPEHLIIWTPKGLRLALQKVGLQALRLRTEGLNPYEILARVRTQKEVVDRNQTGTALNQAFSSSLYRRAIKTGINHFLTALQLGDSLKIYAIRSH